MTSDTSNFGNSQNSRRKCVVLCKIDINYDMKIPTCHAFINHLSVKHPQLSSAFFAYQVLSRVYFD